MLHGKSTTQFEKTLSVPLGQLIQDDSSSGVCKRLIDVRHPSILGK